MFVYALGSERQQHLRGVGSGCVSDPIFTHSHCCTAKRSVKPGACRPLMLPGEAWRLPAKPGNCPVGQAWHAVLSHSESDGTQLSSSLLPFSPGAACLPLALPLSVSSPVRLPLSFSVASALSHAPTSFAAFAMDAHNYV